MAAALRVLMKGTYEGPDLRVFRGTWNHELRRRLYGFSWTTDLAIARRFAEKYSETRGDAWRPTVLATTVSASVILLRREPEDYYDEAEVVVDPYRLDKVRQIAFSGVDQNG